MRYLVSVAGVLVLALAAYLLSRARLFAPEAAELEPEPPPPAVASQPPPAVDPEQQALLNQPQTRDYQAWTDFQARLRAALAEPAPPSDTTNALLAELGQYEALGRVTPNEAAMLRLALAKHAGEEQYRAEAEALAERVRAEGARREAERAAHPDPHFTEYKRREQAIVAEVQALSAIPGGVSRDEYLRQRLQAAREEAYRAGDPSP